MIIEMMDDFKQLMDEQSAWSDKTFDNGRHSTKRALPISHHLQKESKELTEAIDIYTNNPNTETYKQLAEEIADVGLLLLDILAHLDISVEMLYTFMSDKHEINKKRTWGKPDKNGVIEHIRN